MKDIEDLTFSDDYMFGAVMRDSELCKGVLERLLQIKVEWIEYQELQKVIKSGYEVHGIRMDVYVKDNNSVYDIEIQNKNYKTLGQRTRFYQSMMDADFLIAGNQYEKLKKTYILFICKDDPFKIDLHRYTFSTICHEKRTFSLNDRCKKVFYNASKYSKEKDFSLRALLQYIHTNEATDEFTKRLEEKVAEIKRNEIFRTEYMKMGTWEADVRSEAVRETAIKMLKDGLSIELTMKYTNLSLETVQQLADEILLQL